METEQFFRKKTALENELRNYVTNDWHDHHHGYMHVKYDEFYNAIIKYRELLSSESCPYRKEAKGEIIKFLDEELVQRLNGKECEHCVKIANLIAVEFIPK